MVRGPFLALLLLLASGVASAQDTSADGPSALLQRVEQAAVAGNRATIVALFAGDDRGAIEDFSASLSEPKPTRVVIKERDRTANGAGTGMALLVETFVERGIEGHLTTWQLDVEPRAGESAWTIKKVQRLSTVNGLYKLSLTPKQFDIRALKVHAPDLELDMSSGSGFVAETPEGPTAIVLIGKGTMRFAPHDAAERTQVRIFSGSETLQTSFDAAFLRIDPGAFDRLFPAAMFAPRPAQDPIAMRRGLTVFEQYVGRTLQINLSDISRDRWSLTPSGTDLIADVRTPSYGTLTYTRARNDAEDITLFDRARRHNIASYASTEKLARRGPFYDENELVDYDVLDYDINAAFTPDRQFIEGTAKVRLKVRVAGTASLNMRLAESLVVRSVTSPQFGTLLHLRVVGQNSLIVNLPATMIYGTEITLNVSYGGRLAPQQIEGEAIAMRQERGDFQMPLEPQFLYSNRSYWYPQSSVSDYATAKLALTVPANYDVVASGNAMEPVAAPPGLAEGGERRKRAVFEAPYPVRYLSCLISRFSNSEPLQVSVGKAPTGVQDVSSGPADRLDSTAADISNVALVVRANPLQKTRARDALNNSAKILQFYGSLIGEAPYPTFTIALTDGDTPGGHSPAYFALVMQPQPTPNVTPTWLRDPVSFENYPSFFLAHEIAHQWWGQAIGGKNYHEQWISEGFAQYFALLYAQKEKGDGVMLGLMRQMRQTALQQSAQGPIYLGYRLGHIKGDSRIFRSIVYNKGAMVLHMLRRLVGDDAFMEGLRGFYTTWKYKKAGTNDFRMAMEKASGTDLTRFFQTWVYGADIPRVKFTAHVTGSQALVRFEQRGEPADIPFTVTVTYEDGTDEDVLVKVTDRTAERTIPLKARVRSIVANADNAALAIVEK